MRPGRAAQKRPWQTGAGRAAAPGNRETTLPLKWITARVRLGTSKSANPKLHRWLRSHPEPAIAASEKAKTHETTKTN
jgi:hypothetical protein